MSTRNPPVSGSPALGLQIAHHCGLLSSHGSWRLNLGPLMCGLSMRWDPCMVRVCVLLSLLPSGPWRWNNVDGPLIQHHWGLLTRTLTRIYDVCCHYVAFAGPAYGGCQIYL
ncbi:hypothetical protein LEMLEM_LOCUS18840, partial [Lemmus lemmus]